MTKRISALRGMRAVLGAEYAQCRQLQETLEQHLRLHAYAPIDPPMLENTELYLRKSGEGIAARLYEFDFKSRRVALRPELTASVLRACVEQLSGEALPLRLRYSGPVFRYEKPQLHRYRQFTLAGAELLGAPADYADAELLQVACGGLECVGIRDYRLVIGTSALLEGFLSALGLRKQLHNVLLRNMENLRKHGTDFVADSLRAIFPDFQLASPDRARADTPENQPLIHALREMTDEEAHSAISQFLRSLNIRIDANRAESQVIDRLLHKIREDQQAPKLRVALDFMARLSEIVGEPEPALAAAAQLCQAYAVDDSALKQLQLTLRRLADCGEPTGEIQLDFGLSRGLHYYTGMIFEIHGKTRAGEAIQLCGGGRYDKLVSILGGDSMPAAGFAWGIERIASALPAPPDSLRERTVCVIPVADEDVAACQAIAADLRARHIIAEVSADDRGLRRSLKQADRRGASLVIIIGETERATNSAVLRDMRRGAEQPVALTALPAAAADMLRQQEADHAD
ncbi:MAG: ATP phosphoribosyltransferase regulatory subunit [Chloroflexi bacterium]|nr:ATP phosphoribosyltransferase regulatory subunit [Chloroflexota bacterium]MCY4246736.1 ATP phosphoribosyltransferase regulatory subunit [Chloroflexota bacterium]